MPQLSRMVDKWSTVTPKTRRCPLHSNNHSGALLPSCEDRWKQHLWHLGAWHRVEIDRTSAKTSIAQRRVVSGGCEHSHLNKRTCALGDRPCLQCSERCIVLGCSGRHIHHPLDHPLTIRLHWQTETPDCHSLAMSLCHTFQTLPSAWTAPTCQWPIDVSEQKQTVNHDLQSSAIVGVG